VRVDPPLGRRMQTYPLVEGYLAIVAPHPHPLSSPLITCQWQRSFARISMQHSNLLRYKRFGGCAEKLLHFYALTFSRIR
jgi:hypothetical protein